MRSSVAHGACRLSYGAIFLLELNKRFKQPHSPELQGYCLRIVTVLEQIARNRPNACVYSYSTLLARAAS